MADALCWHAAPPDLHLSLGVPPSAVARGLHFRLLTSIEMNPRSEPAIRIREAVSRYRLVMDAMGAMTHIERDGYPFSDVGSASGCPAELSVLCRTAFPSQAVSNSQVSLDVARR